MKLLYGLALFSLLLGCEARDSVSPNLDFDHTRYVAERSFLSSDEASLDHEYAFVNNSNRDVRIANVVAGCSCTAIDFPKRIIGPGQAGSVRLRVNLAQRRGEFDTSAQVNLAGRKEPIVIEIGAFVVNPPRVNPTTISFGEVAVGKSAKAEVDLEVPLGPRDQLPDARLTTHGADFGLTAQLGQFELREGDDPNTRLASAPLSVRLEPAKALGNCEGRIDVVVNGASLPISAAVSWTSVSSTLAVNPVQLVLSDAQPVGKAIVSAANGTAALEEVNISWEGEVPKNAVFRVSRLNDNSFEIEVQLAEGYLDAALAIATSPSEHPFFLRCVGYRD